MVDGLSRLLAKASDNQDAIVNGEIDPLTREFNLVTKSGERKYVGIVAPKGEPGEDGISIVDVQLIEDPEQDNKVFFQTELSNGLILQTRSSIDGYHGASVEAARVEDNKLYFTLEGGVELEPLPVDGLVPISINGAYINAEREVILTLTDGNETPVGLADDLKGRGIEEIYRQAGNLYIKYDDDPDNPLELGRLIGLDKIEMVDGSLTYTTDEEGATAKDLGPIKSITRSAVEDGHLILYTNQPAPDDRWDLGPVENLKGKDGIFVTAVDVSDNTMTFLMSDGTELPPVAVTGLRPIHVVGAEFNADENEVYFVLSDGNKITSGIGNDFKGDGIEYLAFDSTTGEITIKYEKESEATSIGNIPVITDINVTSTGDIEVKWSHQSEPTKVGEMISMETIERDTETGMLTVTMNNLAEFQLGEMKFIESISIDGDDLQVTMTGEEPVTVGSLRGAPGQDGVSFKSGRIDERGYMMVQLDDDSEEKEIGYVRTTIQNLLGQTSDFLWSEGPDFPISHLKNVVMFVGDKVIPPTDLNLDVEDTVSYTGSETFDDSEKVTILSFVMAAPSATGRGIFKVESTSDTAYEITLEDGTLIPIETETPIDPELIPPGIDTAAIDPETNKLTVTKTNGEVINVGPVNSSDNTNKAFIDENGIFHIELDSGKVIPVGSVISNMQITDVTINPEGELLVSINGASEPFNAGPTANYVTDSYIDANDQLIIKTSDGRTIPSGTVRNPILGTIYEFEAVEGQTKFRLDHSEFKVDVSLQGIGLYDDQLDLSDPKYVTLKTPITKDGQRIRVVMYSKGTFKVNGLESAKTAAPNTYYGLDSEGNEGFHPTHAQIAAKPVSLIATQAGQTEFPIYTSGLIDVWVNGSLKHTGYSTNEDHSRLVFDEGLNIGDEIRIIDYTQPQVQNGLLMANYGRLGYQTFSPGGTFTAGDWRVRNLNFVEANGIGADVRNNRLILEAGDYYIRGYAACKGVGNNILKLYNQSVGSDVLMGGAQFAPFGLSRAYNMPDCKTEISGYFSLEQLSALILMHKCTKTYGGYGFGSGNPAGGAAGRYEKIFQEPGRLVDLEIWKIN